jgi:TnpA family transposase
MAIASRHASYDRLVWVTDWFIRDDTYAKALAQIVHFQMANPFAYYWGSGTTSSSDSQHFPIGGTKSTSAHRNPYYGTESGITFYTQVISTRVREAPYMLNGLLHHDTQLDIRRHSTDTKGFTDQIFALCHLLGFSFAPRIRGFKKLKIFTIKQKKFYPTLKPMLGARINTDFIYHDWLDMLRIASALKLGAVTPPVFVQRLAALPQAKSLGENIETNWAIGADIFLFAIDTG